MRRIAIAAALLLAACKAEGSDGYVFEGKEFDRSRPNITVVTHPSFADLRRSAPKTLKVGEGRVLMGWSRITRDGCEMHVVDPASSWQPQWIGHEFAHCAWGRWHPNHASGR